MSHYSIMVDGEYECWGLTADEVQKYLIRFVEDKAGDDEDVTGEVDKRPDGGVVGKWVVIGNRTRYRNSGLGSDPQDYYETEDQFEVEFEVVEDLDDDE